MQFFTFGILKKPDSEYFKYCDSPCKDEHKLIEINTQKDISYNFNIDSALNDYIYSRNSIMNIIYRYFNVQFYKLTSMKYENEQLNEYRLSPYYGISIKFLLEVKKLNKIDRNVLIYI